MPWITETVIAGLFLDDANAVELSVHMNWRFSAERDCTRADAFLVCSVVTRAAAAVV